MVFKHDPKVVNEDALCVVIDDDRTGFAVADAHYGPESSHALIERLHQRWVAQGVPATPDELFLSVASVGGVAETDSETALLVAAHAGGADGGFGLSIGDASLVIVGADHTGAALNPQNHRYVTADGDDAEPLPFAFATTKGDLILAFTDGVDECHYRNPATSIRPSHIAQVAEATARDPRGVVEMLAQLALDGVDGNPGGQDNIAIVAIRA